MTDYLMKIEQRTVREWQMKMEQVMIMIANLHEDDLKNETELADQSESDTILVIWHQTRWIEKMMNNWKNDEKQSQRELTELTTFEQKHSLSQWFKLVITKTLQSYLYKTNDLENIETRIS